MTIISEVAQRVLIVDDDEDMRMILSCLITSVAPVELDLAKNAEQALLKIEESQKSPTPFSLIFMDIRMPSINGIDAAKRIRELGFKGLIAACTAAGSGSGRRDSIEAGIDVYLSKQVIKKDTIAALLEQARQRS